MDVRQALIFAADARRPWLVERSARSLRAAGFEVAAGPDAVASDRPCLILRAGRVLRDPAGFRPPPPGAHVRLVAVGLPVAGEWADFHGRHGGDYRSNGLLPAPECEWHSDGCGAVARIGGGVMGGSARVVHWPPLDLAETDGRLRVYEVVTSLQQGGAEKIARDLALAMPGYDIACRLVVLGRPHRTPLDAPPGTLDCSHLPHAARAAFLTRMAIADGADVLHVHLTDADGTRALTASGIPVMATVHNMRAGWPRGWESLTDDDISLQLACSQAVGRELREVMPQVPVRTVWNGINPDDYPETALPSGGKSYHLACIANPRSQKRLDRLPAIVAATRAELAARGVINPAVSLVIAGEASPLHADAMACRTDVEREAVKHGVADCVNWTDGKIPVRDVLAAAHALVSCSAHEGLSLAHLEALAAGRAVVACDTGGTRELAWRNAALVLLDRDAGPGEFAAKLADVLLGPPPSARKKVWRDFTIWRMAERVARLARQVACRPRDGAGTLWFVSNNLSTGGAQSSLRRLSKALHERGRRVRLALLQEYPEHPTAGRRDLTEHGIDVFVPPPAGLIDPAAAVELILAEMAADAPAAVIFWNAITDHKLLLADALPFTKIYDISPGEMWFASFDRCMENPPPGLPCRNAADYGALLDGIVVKYAAEAERAAVFGVPVTVIPNGVAVPEGTRGGEHDEPGADRRDALSSLTGGTPVFLGTAVRISGQKRLDELLEAFRLALRALPGLVLRIAGGVETGADAHAAELRWMAEGLPVEWLGETADLTSFHAQCDIFVMVSDPAGCPNASLEALAAGLPVIATDVGGTSEQVIDDVTGLLVPARDVAALAQAMVDLAGDPARRERLGRAACEHIRNHFTLARMVDDYSDLLDR